MPPCGAVNTMKAVAAAIASGIDQSDTAILAKVYTSPPPTPANSNRLKGMPMKPFSSLDKTCDLNSATIGTPKLREARRMALPHECKYADGETSGKRDDGGDAARRDDEQEA